MAGYDFFMTVPARYRQPANTWMRSFQREGDARLLEVTWRSRKSEKAGCEYFVSVQGSIEEMQALQRDLAQFQYYHGLIHKNRERISQYVFKPFLVENGKGVHGITEMIHSHTKRWGARVIAEGAIGPQVSRGLLSSQRTPFLKICEVVVRSLDDLAANRIQPKQALIISDQAIEEFLKTFTSLLNSRGISFQQIAEKAAESKVISRRASTALLRHHRLRNGLQHAGKAVPKHAVMQIIRYHIDVLNKYAEQSAAQGKTRRKLDVSTKVVSRRAVSKKWRLPHTGDTIIRIGRKRSSRKT